MELSYLLLTTLYKFNTLTKTSYTLINIYPKPDKVNHPLFYFKNIYYFVYLNHEIICKLDNLDKCVRYFFLYIQF